LPPKGASKLLSEQAVKGKPKSGSVLISKEQIVGFAEHPAKLVLGNGETPIQHHRAGNCWSQTHV